MAEFGLELSDGLADDGLNTSSSFSFAEDGFESLLLFVGDTRPDEGLEFPPALSSAKSVSSFNVEFSDSVLADDGLDP